MFSYSNESTLCSLLIYMNMTNSVSPNWLHSNSLLSPIRPVRKWPRIILVCQLFDHVKFCVFSFHEIFAFYEGFLQKSLQFLHPYIFSILSIQFGSFLDISQKSWNRRWRIQDGGFFNKMTSYSQFPFLGPIYLERSCPWYEGYPPPEPSFT